MAFRIIVWWRAENIRNHRKEARKADLFILVGPQTMLRVWVLNANMCVSEKERTWDEENHKSLEYRQEVHWKRKRRRSLWLLKNAEKINFCDTRYLVWLWYWQIRESQYPHVTLLSHVKLGNFPHEKGRGKINFRSPTRTNNAEEEKLICSTMSFFCLRERFQYLHVEIGYDWLCECLKNV